VGQVPDPLLILTAPRIVGGVDPSDVAWALTYTPKKGEYLYFDEDLAHLEDRGLLPSGCLPGLRYLIAKADSDFEIRKGLYLIYTSGHRPPHLFPWRKAQDFNTQLLMLCYLLHYGLSEGEERLALAAALDYGSILTISDQHLWPRIVEFARHRLHYVSATSTVLQAYGADWDPQSYPLHACIGLLWGAVSQGGYREVRCNLARSFRERPMGAEEFAFFFVLANTMVELRDWLIQHGLFSRRAHLQGFVQDHPVLGNGYDSRLSTAAELCIHLSWQLDIWHPDWPVDSVNWQWRYYKDCGHVSGACGASGKFGCFSMRSVNIAALEQPHGYWHYVPEDDVWRVRAREMIGYLSEQAEHGALWTYDPTTYYKIAWDNFHLGRSAASHGENLVVFYVSRDASCVPRGIPGGYVFRRSLPRSCWWSDKYTHSWEDPWHAPGG
jgi:hypothetical protein